MNSLICTHRIGTGLLVPTPRRLGGIAAAAAAGGGSSSNNTTGFSFADSPRVRPQQIGRRNRTLEKRKEEELRSLVHGLCAFNDKQLRAVSHLLPVEHMAAIRIAADIPPTNQGRRRQEGLVMKLMRAELDNINLDKLALAVTGAARTATPYADADVEAQLAVWLSGLEEERQEVVEEVHALVQQRGLDWQTLRALVRQLQQAREQQQQQQQVLMNESAQAAASPSTDGEQGDMQQPPVPGTAAAAAMPRAVDPEVANLMLELAAGQATRSAARRRTGGKAAPGSAAAAAATARRSLRRMLKPLALERVA